MSFGSIQNKHQQNVQSDAVHIDRNLIHELSISEKLWHDPRNRDEAERIQMANSIIKYDETVSRAAEKRSEFINFFLFLNKKKKRARKQSIVLFVRHLVSLIFSCYRPAQYTESKSAAKQKTPAVTGIKTLLKVL